MDPELKGIVEETLRLTKENNDILRSMRRNAQWSLVGKIIFWILFVIAPLIFVWGYIGPLMSIVNGGNGTPGINTGDLQKLLNQYKGTN